MRFTDEHRNFRDFMNILFDLYNHLNKNKKQSVYSDIVIKLIAKLCYKIVPKFSPCRYFESMKSFYFRNYSGSISLEERSHYKDTQYGLVNFINIMNALREDLKKSVRNQITIKELICETHGYKLLKDSGYVDWIKNAGLAKKDFGDYNWLKYDKSIGNKYKYQYMDGEPVIEIYPQAEEDDHKERYRQWGIMLEKVLNDPPIAAISFKVSYDPKSYFFQSLQISSTEEIISRPSYFSDFIRYAFVHYIALFGSFDRIGICKMCGNFFFRKKSNYGVYCSDLCRVNFHVESENKDIFRCRARQNRWAVNNFELPYTVQKGDCSGCLNQPIGEKQPKGGKCLLLLEKHKLDSRRKKKKFHSNTGYHL